MATDSGQIDLGNRIVDVIPIPGHDVASIALYDRLRGTTYQPKEHVLELSRAHVIELNEAFKKIGRHGEQPFTMPRAL